MILPAPGHACALDHVQADAAEAEHHDVFTDLDLGGVDHRAHARRHAATDVAARLERRVLADIFASAISGSTVKFENVEQPM